MPRRLVKIILWTLAAIFAFAGLAVLLLFTEFVQTRIAKHFLDDYNETISGSIEFGSVHAGLSGELIVTELSLKDSLGNEVLGLSKLRVRLRLEQLLDNELHISLLKLSNLRADIEADSAGNTNLMAALTPKAPALDDSTTAASSAAWSIDVRKLEIEGAHTRLSLDGVRMLDLDEWELLAAGVFDDARLAYELKLQSGDLLAVNSDGTIELREDQMMLSAKLHAETDSALLLPLPAPAPKLGSLKIDADIFFGDDSLRAEFDLHSSSAGFVNGYISLNDVSADFFGGGLLRFRDINLAPFTGDTLASNLAGALSFEKSATPDYVNGWDAQLVLNNSHFMDQAVACSLDVVTHDSTADVKGKIETPSGAALLDLFADGFDPATMSLEGSVHLNEVDVHHFAAAVPDSLSPLSGDITLAFASLNPDSLRGDAYLRIQSFSFGEQALDTAVVALSIHNQAFRVDTLLLRLDSITVSGAAQGARGETLTFDVQGQIPELADTRELLRGFDVELDSLSGKLHFDLTGTASLAGDSLSNLHMEGIVRLDSAQFDTITVELVELNLNSVDVNSGRLSCDGRVIALKLGAQTLDSIVCSLEGDPENFATSLEVWALGDTLHLKTDFATRIIADEFAFTFDSLRAHAFGIDWQLRYPTDVHYLNDRIELDGLTIASRFGVLRAVGFVQPKGEQDLTIELSGFETSSIAEFLDAEVPDARVNIRLQLTGTDSALIGDATIHVDSMIFDGKLVSDEIFLSASVAGDSAVIEGHSLWYNDTLIAIAGVIPARLSFDNGFTLLESLPVSGRAKVFEQPLERLNPWLGTGTKAGGFLSADMEISGTPRDPSWEGSFSVREGRYVDPQIGVNYRYMVIDGKFFGDSLIINQFRATSRGTLTGSGYAIMGFPLPERVDVQLKFDKFNAVESARMQARLSGNIAMTGPVDSLDVSGRLTVEEALYRISQATSKQIEEIDLEGYLAKLRGDSIAEDGLLLGYLYLGMSHELAVDIPGNCWIRGQGLSIELFGSLQLEKEKNSEPVVDGEIKVRRGNATFVGREMQVESGTFAFTGPLDDPELDIIALDTKIYRREGAEIRAHLYGPVTNTRVDFSGRLADGTEMTLEEVIRALLLGTTQASDAAASFDVSKSAAEIAASPLSHMVERASGLDIFQFRPGEEGLNDLSKGSLEVGTYITDRLFVRVLQPIETTQSGQEVNIEYQLREWLKLIAEQKGKDRSAVDLFIQVEWR